MINSFKYPYLLVLAEKEKVVDNSGAKIFHSKTSSKVKKLVTMKDSYHELHKEPNKNDFHKLVLQFFGERLSDKNSLKPFGDIRKVNIKTGYLEMRRRMLTKRKVALLTIFIYVIIGIL